MRSYLPVDDSLLALLASARREALVDQRLPGAPAGEAMRRVAAKYPGLPMIVVTAYDDPPSLPHQGFFTKPFDTGQLLAAVERLHRSHPGAHP